VTRASAWKNYLIDKYQSLGNMQAVTFLRNHNDPNVQNLFIDCYADNVNDPYARANMNPAFA